MTVRGAGEKVREAVILWSGVEAHPHRFGGIEYRLGTREIGHMHGDTLVDIPFPTKVRDELIAARRAQPHHVLPESGWVSFYIRESDDVAQAIALLRQSYDLAMRQKSRPEKQVSTDNREGILE